LLEQKIVGGLPLRKFYPELGNAALWCCTELTTKVAIDAVVGALGSSAPKNSIKEERDVAEVAR